MRYLLSVASLFVALPAFAADPPVVPRDLSPAKPGFTAAPAGFTPLFNGKDLSGWHGWAIHAKGAAPFDLVKLAPEERAKKVEEWTADAGKHWSVENGELVNDGKGAYLATD